MNPTRRHPKNQKKVLRFSLGRLRSPHTYARIYPRTVICPAIKNERELLGGGGESDDDISVLDPALNSERNSGRSSRKSSRTNSATTLAIEFSQFAELALLITTNKATMKTERRRNDDEEYES